MKGTKKIKLIKPMVLALLVGVCMLSTTATAARYYTTTGLNCRSYPSMDEDIYTVFPTGTAVDSIKEYNGWIKVTDGTTTGWCYGRYLSTTKSNKKYLGNFKVTYYTPSPRENGGWSVTAKGQKLKDVVGICVAADPRVVPYYSKIYIEGVGERTVLDCGGAIKGNRLDVLTNKIPSRGVHYSDVYLLN